VKVITITIIPFIIQFTSLCNKLYKPVQFQPLPATPLSPEGEMMSATAPPRIPEPFLYRADLLLEAESGKVVARRLYCVIY